MMTLLGSGLILLASMALMVAFVLRTPRAVRNQERQAIEKELEEVNYALSAFGRGQPIALIKNPSGVIQAVTRRDFSSLLARKRHLCAQLVKYK